MTDKKVPHYQLHRGERPRDLVDAIKTVVEEQGLTLEQCMHRFFAGDKDLVEKCVRTGSDRDEHSSVYTELDAATMMSSHLWEEKYPPSQMTYAHPLEWAPNNIAAGMHHLKVQGKFSIVIWKKSGLKKIPGRAFYCLMGDKPQEHLVAVFSNFGTEPLPVPRIAKMLMPFRRAKAAVTELKQKIMPNKPDASDDNQVTFYRNEL